MYDLSAIFAFFFRHTGITTAQKDFSFFNPVRARLCGHAWDYPWSSAAAHVAVQADDLVKTTPRLGLVTDWRAYVSTDARDAQIKALRKHALARAAVGFAGFRPRARSDIGALPCSQEARPKARAVGGCVQLCLLPTRLCGIDTTMRCSSR